MKIWLRYATDLFIYYTLYTLAKFAEGFIIGFFIFVLVLGLGGPTGLAANPARGGYHLSCGAGGGKRGRGVLSLCYMFFSHIDLFFFLIHRFFSQAGPFHTSNSK